MSAYESDILAALKRIEAKVDALAKRKPAAAESSSANVATDAELDGQYGDPKVFFNPKDWRGVRVPKGTPFSECDQEFLEMLANSLEFFANRNAADDPKKAGYERRDAARARGWARRKRAGWKRQEAPSGGSYDFDDMAGEEGSPYEDAF